MIRINLLNSFGATNPDKAAIGEESTGSVLILVRNIFVMLVGVVSLIVYEGYSLPTLQAEVTKLQAQLAELTSFNQKKEAIRAEIEKYEADRQRLNRQTDFLQMIQVERTQTVQLLTKVQQIIPENLWLVSLKIEGQNIEIKGEADSEKEVNEFNLRLSSLPFLKDVIVLSIEMSTASDALKVPTKIFNLKATLAKVDVKSGNEGTN